MAAAYIEHRPKSTDKDATVSHYTIVSEGQEHGTFKTQKEAHDQACKQGYHPVHVARVRHLHDHKNPDHFRVDPC